MRTQSWKLALIAGVCAITSLSARESPEPAVGLHENTPRVHALVGGTVIVAPGSKPREGTIVLRDGIIEKVTFKPDVPADARVWDMSGKVIYAGFIDAYSHAGMPDGLKPFIRQTPKASEGPSEKKVPSPKPGGATFWNELVTPQRQAADFFSLSDKEVKNLHELGFTATATYPGRGIFRGEGMLTHVDSRGVNESSIKMDVAQHVAFEFTGRDGGYPGSLMGSIALVRQTLLDARWYGECLKVYAANPGKVERPEANEALESLIPLADGRQLALYQAWDELDFQRIETVAGEIGSDYAILGNGYEYRRTAVLEKSGATIVLPLAFPDAPPVERPDTALEISLEQLEHWELAPANPAILEQSGTPFCISNCFMEDPSKEFWPALRKAIAYGLSTDTALAGLTTVPAELYDVEDRLGTIEKGKIANLLVVTGDMFTDADAEVAMVWVDGNPVELEPWSALDLDGKWKFSWNGIDGFKEGNISADGGKLKLKIGEQSHIGQLKGRDVLLFIDAALMSESEDSSTLVQLYGMVQEDGSLTGTGSLSGDVRFSWDAKRVGTRLESSLEASGKEDEDPPQLNFSKYPAGAFGVAERQQHKEILVRNATVWTSGPQGILENADVLFRKGKVVRIAHDIKAARDAHVIDAAGKHLTPGIIDCHSHLAISNGVNEGTLAMTAEVRISDVVNAVDINIYRQLAGGVTASNSLHGSANPIGGQGQVLRLRWGSDAEGLKFHKAFPGIKFALGENVKQSNWGEATNRYPQTRMGVIEIMESYFRAAADYARHQKEFDAGKRLLPPRRDLAMDAMLETLKGERAVHIHAYRQDEILEFSRLADQFDVTVAVFHHVLEGYKVAEALSGINAGGSSFSDWWAYKFEVYDAIPHNAAMMHGEGVLVSINSDDAELATRLTTEAAKTVKYGGVSEEDALKFVTINAAMQLGVDEVVGSLEPGKDADFVIWSGHPLSTFTHAEQTWIEGIRYFDIDENKELARRDALERERLLQKALKARLKDLKLGSPGNKNDPPKEGHKWLYQDENFDYSGLRTRWEDAQ